MPFNLKEKTIKYIIRLSPEYYYATKTYHANRKDALRCVSKEQADMWATMLRLYGYRPVVLPDKDELKEALRGLLVKYQQVMPDDDGMFITYCKGLL